MCHKGWRRVAGKVHAIRALSSEPRRAAPPRRGFGRTVNVCILRSRLMAEGHE